MRGDYDILLQALTGVFLRFFATKPTPYPIGRDQVAKLFSTDPFLGGTWTRRYYYGKVVLSPLEDEFQ